MSRRSRHASCNSGVTIGEAGVLISEVVTVGPHGVEIQNVSHGPLDVSGWRVLVNDASSGINGVGSLA